MRPTPQVLVPKPNVVKDTTDYAAEGFYVDSNLIRFAQGLPEQLGGWQALSLNILGTISAIYSWQLLSGREAVAIGTSEKVYVFVEDILYNITPARATGTLTDKLQLFQGSTLVRVSDVGTQVEVGDHVIFSGFTPIYNMNINGEWVVTAASTDYYEFNATTAASQDATGIGGTWNYIYELPPGEDTSSFGNGYGIGPYGGEDIPEYGGYGTGYSNIDTGAVVSSRIWTFASWGEDLLLSPQDGNLYFWDATNFANRATLVATAPTTIRTFVVDNTSGHVILFGVAGDRKRIDWCNAGDYTNWTISEVTDAGRRHIYAGSNITGATSYQNTVLFWLDSGELYGLRYTGALDYAYDLLEVAKNVPLIGSRTYAQMSSVLYWLSPKCLYAFDGTVKALPSTVQTFVVDDINLRQRELALGGTFSSSKEVIFFFPSLDAIENDKYIKFNTLEGSLDVGYMGRSAWCDTLADGKPLGALGSTIYKHEIGDKDNGAYMNSWLESSRLDIGDGDKLTFLSRLMPDIRGAAALQVWAAPDSLTSMRQIKLTQIDAAHSDISVRVRGRQLKYRIQGTGSYWRLGKILGYIQVDGDR